MKILKSIKWRLQLWYGLILLSVLLGFGLTAYQLEFNRQFRQVDEELHRRMGALANALHRPPPRGQNAGRPPQGLPPDGEDFNRPPPGEDLPPRPADRPRNDFPNQRPLLEFHLPAQDEHFFYSDDPHRYYYRIAFTNPLGQKVVATSSNQPAGEVYRQFENVLPSGEAVLVGCSVSQELRELHLAGIKLAGVGALILLLGLAGGWWFVGRALKPINAISTTAVKIAAGDLSQRINSAEAESELGQLAAVLNSTFARLETAFAQQKQFASDAAHELRTPVSVILTQTQTALNRERDDASYKQTVEACQRAAQRMRKLIESLLALARFDAGQEVLNRLPFDFSKAIADCAELVQPLADERGVKIFFEAKPLEIIGDSERLAQVVTNLLTNAIQYNQPDGEVRVKLATESDLAVLTIADTGQGIAAENLPRVFGRFFRADAARTGAGNAGLGLSICKAIVEAHGGTIEAASEQNVGTTFTVRLPV
jgi:heavy metal sensor kinase